MFVVFMFVIAAVGTAVYLLLFMSQVPGAQEERFGKLEPLPPRLGEWQRSDVPEADGTIAELRFLFHESTGLGAGKLVRQMRFRDPITDEIVRVGAEETVKRKRIRV